MSNRELCVSMLDSFTESQLGNVAAMLQTMKKAIEDAMGGHASHTGPAPASPLHFTLFLVSFVIGYLVNWVLAALLGMCAFITLMLGPWANAKGFIMKLLSGSIFPLWFFPAWARNVLELLPFMNIYQLPLGIYIGQYSMNEIVLRTGLQLLWCGALWLVFYVLQKKASDLVLIQGG